jgi:hypothetical protein
MKGIENKEGKFFIKIVIMKGKVENLIKWFKKERNIKFDDFSHLVIVLLSNFKGITKINLLKIIFQNHLLTWPAVLLLPLLYSFLIVSQ